jgi:hypothetical protein
MERYKQGYRFYPHFTAHYKLKIDHRGPQMAAAST